MNIDRQAIETPISDGHSGDSSARYLTPVISSPRIFAEPEPTGQRTAAVVLCASDVLLVVVAFAATHLLRSIVTGHKGYGWTIVGAAAAWIALRWYLRLYPGIGLPAPQEFRQHIVTTFIAGFSQIAILFGLHQASASRFDAFGTWLVIGALGLSVRLHVKRWLINTGRFNNPTIIFGAGATGALVIRELLANPTLGLVPLAVFDDDASKSGTTLHGIPILGPLELAISTDFGCRVRHGIIALPRASGAQLVDLTRDLGRRFTSLRIVPDLFGIGHLWVEPGSVGTCLAFELHQERFDARSRRLKRTLDLALGVPLFLLALPIIVVSALGVVIADGGVPFYSQDREGLDGERVRVWKIRTMVRDAEDRLKDLLDRDPKAQVEWATSMKLRQDPRVIRMLGGVLRKYSIDELPQLLSVVLGHLSLVGPRPFPDYHLEMFHPSFRDLRRQVPPGITGYWQVTSRSDGDLSIQENADSYYIQNWSLWLDLWILYKTIEVVLSGRGSY